MTTNPDLNNVPNTFIRNILPRMRENVEEMHLDGQCQYRILKGMRFGGTGKPVIILIRLCKGTCRMKTDRSHMLSRNEIQFDELYDGVEAHLSSECRFEVVRQPDGKYRHTKVCECPGDKPTAQR